MIAIDQSNTDCDQFLQNGVFNFDFFLSWPAINLLPSIYHGFFFLKVQVTNPPIDPIREGEVMSLSMAIGRRGHVLNSAQDDDQATSLLMAQSPVLDGSEMTTLRNGKYVFALY
jgi:hypothetical protein